MFRELHLEVIASWPPGDYHNGIRRGPELFIVTAIFLTIATTSLIARLYSRVWIRRYFGLDDGLLIFAYLATLGVTASSFIGHIKYGWDRHVWDLEPTKFDNSLKVLYVARNCWGMATSGVRLSICALYYRILNRLRGAEPIHFRHVLHAFTAFQIALTIVYFFTGLLPCLPIRAYWNFAPIPGQKCVNEVVSMKTTAIVNTISEFVLAFLPIAAVRKLAIDPAQRWTVISLLSLGFIVGFAGCFRTYYLWRSMSSHNMDMSWWADPHWIASQVEIDLAIACACAAPLKPLFSYFIRRAQGLPARLPTIGGKRPTLTTSNSKHDELDYDFQPGWVAPVPQYVDLEGLPTDGYGYTVVISGPQRRTRSRLRRRRSVHESVDRTADRSGGGSGRGSPMEEGLVVKKPALAYIDEKSGGSGPPVISIANIATTREVEVRESWHWQRRDGKYSPYDTRLSSVGSVDEPGRFSAKIDRSWFRE